MKNTAILLVDCPDRKGIAAAIANFLYENDANILHSDQHEDEITVRFLLRVEWNLLGCKLDFDGFKTNFTPIAENFSMRWRMERSNTPTKLAVFVSRFDHCLADLLYRDARLELSCKVAVVISNHTDAKRLCDFYAIPFYHVPVTATTKSTAEARQLQLLAKYKINLVALARYMQVLSVYFLTKFAQPIINVHHSFLPAFSGARPYHRAFERGVKLIGATSHYVTEDLDEGPIIEQGVARVSHRDQLDELIERGRDLERTVLSKAIAWHGQHRILVYNGKTVIFD